MFSFLICIGSQGGNLRKTFQKDVKDIIEVDNIEEAVATASLMAKENDIVLFSPACKSDIKGETYIERGKFYKDFVKQMENEHRQ